MITHETEQQFVDISTVQLDGRILDVGGGGEGIISRHSGNAVVAIDIRKEELEEAPDICLKIVMDACDLKFLDSSFETITCFFSLMYMSEKEVSAFLKEAKRVLKQNGALWIWDTEIPTGIDANIFVAQLKVKISDDSTVTTGYGVGLTRSQSISSIRALCVAESFVVESEVTNGLSFMLRLRK